METTATATLPWTAGREAVAGVAEAVGLVELGDFDAGTDFSCEGAETAAVAFLAEAVTVFAGADWTGAGLVADAGTVGVVAFLATGFAGVAAGAAFLLELVGVTAGLPLDGVAGAAFFTGAGLAAVFFTGAGAAFTLFCATGFFGTAAAFLTALVATGFAGVLATAFLAAGFFATGLAGLTVF